MKDYALLLQTLQKQRVASSIASGVALLSLLELLTRSWEYIIAIANEGVLFYLHHEGGSQ